MNSSQQNKAIKERFTQIYDSYKGSIYKFCLVRLKGDEHRAEDCMQNTFIVLYKKMRNREEIENPRAFLYKTAQNCIMKCYDEIKRDNERNMPLDDYSDKIIDTTQELDRHIDYEMLNEQFNAVLNEDEQYLLKMKYIYDMKIEQIAKILNISKPAVAKRLQRLREKLKDNIEIT